MTVYTPDEDWTEVDYAGPAVIAAGANHPILKLSIFRCTGTRKAAVVWLRLQGFRFTSLNSTIDSDGAGEQGEIGSLLDAGYDVALVSLPVARDAGGALTGNDVSDAAFDVDIWDEASGTPHYGDAYDGNGMIEVDTSAGSFTVPTGYDDTPHPTRDPARIEAFKATVMATQYIMANRAAIGWSGIDIGGAASSAGADCLMWVFFNSDLATYHFPSGTGQDMVSTGTAYRFAVLLRPNVKFDALDSSDFVPSTAKTVAAGGDPHYDEQSATIADTDAANLAARSSLSYAVGHQSPIFALGGVQDTTMLAPYDDTNTGTTEFHSNWDSAALKNAFGSACHLVLQSVGAAESAAMTAAGIAWSVVAGEEQIRAAIVAWLDGLYAVGGGESGIIDGFVATPLWTEVIAAVPGRALERAGLNNRTNVRLDGSWDGVTVHFHMEPGDVRSWGLCELNGATKAYLRGSSADPTSGAVLASSVTL